MGSFNAPEGGGLGEAEVVRQMRELVQDFFSPSPAVYWADLLIGLVLAYPAAAFYLLASQMGAWHLLAFLVSGFALFRLGTFIHEIQHLGKGQMVAFKVVWNALCGIPLLIPSYMYDHHADHHHIHHYGTERDGEYLPLGSGPLSRMILYLLEIPFLPLWVLLRFGVLAPLSLLHRGLREWVLEHASSYGINPFYRRSVPPSAPRGLWALTDLVCCLWIFMWVGLLALGYLPKDFLTRLYVLLVFTVGLNWIRTLAAHRYRSGGKPMSRLGQLEDSLTISGPPLLTELLFPLGLRYHALHHLFPAIPYHHLGKAHQRLLARLPDTASYRHTLCPGLLPALRQLWAEARGYRPSFRGKS